MTQSRQLKMSGTKLGVSNTTVTTSERMHTSDPSARSATGVILRISSILRFLILFLLPRKTQYLTKQSIKRSYFKSLDTY